MALRIDPPFSKMAPGRLPVSRNEAPFVVEYSAAKRAFGLAGKCLLGVTIATSAVEAGSFLLNDRFTVADGAVKKAVLTAVNNNDCMLASVANSAPIPYDGAVDVLHLRPVAGGVTMRIGGVGSNGRVGTVTYRLRLTDGTTGKSEYYQPDDFRSATCAANIIKLLNSQQPAPAP